MGLLVSVVARAHHCADSSVGKAHAPGLAFEHLEDIRVHVAAHRQVVAAGREVLADGQHLDVVGAHVVHHGQDLVVGFAQADHQAALCRHRGVQGLELLQQV